MHKFTKIYLDLDGVIADFNKRYRELYDCEPSHDDARKRFGARFGAFIQNKEFQNLDMMPDATELLSYLKTCGAVSYTHLTLPTIYSV